MTLQRWENGAEVALTQPIIRLVEWAQEADAAYSLAERLTSTVFCPEQFRGKPADAAAAMLAGGELGLSPLTALSAFDVIQGRAAARAITLRALAQSKGHEIVLLEATNTKCRMKGRRASSTEWQTVTWTIDRAKELGLTGKSNWRQQPQTMLIARATSELARLIASDALLGIGGGLSSEELRDGSTDTEPPPVVEPAAKPTRKLAYKAPTAEPASEEPSADAEPQEASDEQRKMMFALLGELGITERDKYLTLASWHTKRELGSTDDMTRDEKSRFIDYLTERRDGMPQEPPADDIDGPLIGGAR